MRTRINTMERFYCMRCKSTQLMRELPDEIDPDKDGFKCLICGTVHKHANLWKSPPRTIQE